MTDNVKHKDRPWALVGLEVALEMEWQKFSVSPIRPDLVPEYTHAQAWGYVVAAYSLLEQGFKEILHSRERTFRKTHELTNLFDGLPANDQDVLRAHHCDFWHAFPGLRWFRPPPPLDDFLENLDGRGVGRGKCLGSVDWRYALTQEAAGASLPSVSINAMHEIMYGCVELLRSIQEGTGKASRADYSWRLHEYRWGFHREWLDSRLNSSGRDQEGDRLEILWGPDYRERYDYVVVKGSRGTIFFRRLPNTEESDVPVVDKRRELEVCEIEKSFRSIGATSNRPARNRDPGCQHIMY